MSLLNSANQNKSIEFFRLNLALSVNPLNPENSTKAMMHKLRSMPWGPYPNPPGHQTLGPPASDIWWSSLETCPNSFHWGPASPPVPVLTCGSHRSMYGWQACGMHTTAMLFCCHRTQWIQRSHLGKTQLPSFASHKRPKTESMLTESNSHILWEQPWENNQWKFCTELPRNQHKSKNIGFIHCVTRGLSDLHRYEGDYGPCEW